MPSHFFLKGMLFSLTHRQWSLLLLTAVKLLLLPLYSADLFFLGGGGFHKKSKPALLQRIPFHCGISRNETADKLAKKGCTIQQTLSEEVCYRSVSSIIKLTLRNIYKFKLKRKTRQEPWNTTFLNLLTYLWYRAVAVLHMTTMHNCLYAHLYRLKVVNSPAYSCTAATLWWLQTTFLSA